MALSLKRRENWSDDPLQSLRNSSMRSQPHMHPLYPFNLTNISAASPPMASFLPIFLSLLFLSLISLFFCVASHAINPVEEEEDDMDVVQSREIIPRKREYCNLSVGKWVYDQSYPLYDMSCPYLSSKVSCQKNGRPDSDYQKWRWKPHGCSVPRFDALEFLGRMRRKRIMLVGDSIMRGQWESLVCLIEPVIPSGRKTITHNGPSMAFHVLDFGASIEFSWAPFLVDLNLGLNNKRILHLDSIQENANFWRGVDILVFDSAHWWTHSDQWSSWDFYMEGGKLFTNLNPMVAYEKGLTTWANWVNLNLNPQKTRVIFRSVSPRHNRENGLKCYKQREPLGYFRHQPHLPGQYLVLQGVLRKMKYPVYLLDITAMSALRRDGHPSVYSRILNEEGRVRPEEHSILDCSHWCLPGVPDTWNELLSALL